MSNKHLHEPLIFSCDYNQYVAGENIIPEHGLVHVFAGTLEMNNGQKTVVLKAGDTYFAAKNNLFRFTKIASANQPLKTVSIAFSTPVLQHFYAQLPVTKNEKPLAKHFLVQKHSLWDTYFKSLEPYMSLKERLPDALPWLKQQEALYILRTVLPEIDPVLSDFSMPGKLDLDAFMQQNYIFNLRLERFAYLTGRSLSAFKRDFRAIYHTTPQRWLTLKRLELAHYLIKEKKVRPSSAYIEAGFENFSHFSDAFKKQFGYNPSQLKA